MTERATIAKRSERSERSGARRRSSSARRRESLASPRLTHTRLRATQPQPALPGDAHDAYRLLCSDGSTDKTCSGGCVRCEGAHAASGACTRTRRAVEGSTSSAGDTWCCSLAHCSTVPRRSRAGSVCASPTAVEAAHKSCAAISFDTAPLHGHRRPEGPKNIWLTPFMFEHSDLCG